jgi:hypothetical protein
MQRYNSAEAQELSFYNQAVAVSQIGFASNCIGGEQYAIRGGE